eukprot:TRINITY_DN25027_c0_g1_i1.p1 TRINITY_DN25027_c0_g1~~TRINITY_DN25027_c0_g1_i1.p1  ORF type:complete len:358 (-),score=49.44 TRINITY_DN25027_c0_g1_i1:101-1174(-)
MQEKRVAASDCMESLMVKGSTDLPANNGMDCQKMPPFTEICEDTLPEELLERLFLEGASGDLVLSWAEAEADEFSSRKLFEATTSGSHLRSVALVILRELTNASPIGFEGWCDAVLLLDTYYFCEDECMQGARELLFPTCVAVVQLLEKHFCVLLNSTPDLVLLANRILVGLKVAQVIDDNMCREVTLEAVKAQEMVALRALDLRVVDRPSAMTWLRTIGKRFNLMSRYRFAPSIDWIMQWASTYFHFLLSVKHAAAMPPRQASNGFLCLGLMCAGVFPAHAFRPDDLDIEDWLEQVTTSGLCAGTLPSCTTPDRFTPSMLSLLQVASRCSLEDLVKDTSAVISTLRACTLEGSPEQ